MIPIEIETLLYAWVGIGVAGALATLLIGFARLRGRPRPPEPLREPPPAVSPVPGEARPEPTVAPGAAPPVAERRAPPEAPAAAVEPSPVAPSPPALPLPDLRRGLSKTRLAFLGRLEQLLRGRPELEPALLEEIEAVLYGADIGARTAEDLLEAARGAGSPDGVTRALQERALAILGAAAPVAVPPPAAGSPRVVLVVGVNGSGKTTTIGKLAARYAAQGRRVLLAAADTFRAAAMEQLEVWAERAGARIVKGPPGGDPAAVAFDALKSARAWQIDDVIIDTAGRLQSHTGLMDELAKIARAVQKQLPGAPHEVLLVMDANTGQNGLRQAQEFTRAAGVTGIVLAKLDGTAKGGVVLGIAQELGVPVRYVGLGEGIGDLVDFDPQSFVRALFATDAESLQAG